MKKELRSRWLSGDGARFVDNLVYHGRGGNGFEVRDTPFGLVPNSCKSDLRGLTLPEHTKLRRLTISRSDMSGASLDFTSLIGCTFLELSFDRASCRAILDDGSKFEKCSMRSVNLTDAVLGWSGSKYLHCEFIECAFRRSSFARPEFDDCTFEKCSLNGVDFNGASFERCGFVGDLRDVWFRGGFPSPSDVDTYGAPRGNRMLNVNFSSARLFGVMFSNHCDLSSVTPPSDGRHRVFDRWEERLDSFCRIIPSLPPDLSATTKLFCDSHLVDASTQEYYLLGLDDLVEQFGDNVSAAIWNGLSQA